MTTRTVPRTARDYRFDLFGYRFSVDVRSPRACTLLFRLYGPFRTRGVCDAEVAARFAIGCEARGSRLWCVTLDGEPLGHHRTLGGALQSLEYAICVRALAYRTDLIVLHGATVLARDGTCALFITGGSGAGKSTLALALAARGYVVRGDDAALLDPRTGALIPFPRCAHLDARSRRLLHHAGTRIAPIAARSRFVTPADLGGRQADAVTVCALLAIDSGRHRTARIAPLPQAAMVLRLLGGAGWNGVSADMVLAALARFVAGTTCYRLERGSLRSCVALLAGLLGAAAPERAPQCARGRQKRFRRHGRAPALTRPARPPAVRARSLRLRARA